ncbi:GntR family transcriptional regulator [Nonomuraea wenchangensis]
MIGARQRLWGQKMVTTNDGRPNSLAHDAYVALRELIVTCRLAPGERITEKRVAAELGFGLTPVRRALLRLNHEGLVRTLPRKGYQVAPLSIASVHELFQAWRILAPAIVELAFGDMTARDASRLVAKEREKARRAREASDDLVLVEQASELWMTLAERTGNVRLLEMYMRLLVDLRRVFTLVLQDPVALNATKFGSDELWALMGPGRTRESIEQFIDVAHRAVLEILLSRPSVAQAEVVVPVGKTAQ